jgi:DNA polymerase-3 subunit gamma/tau
MGPSCLLFKREGRRMHQALYRKYRPKTFDDVVGQQHITTILKNEIATGRIAHAYLFTGSRGTGKTSCARIVAKALNCENPKSGNPCCICAPCRFADEGTLMDLLEIDAATNSGVDNIRELRESSGFSPGMARYRVYIIDEVHMLSTSAFNALLKIMEEPPEHLIFILATTEVHKVLPTIISRCQRFDFKRIDAGEIARHLLWVASKEKIALTEEAARLIARLSEGGMRDALSLLDVCAARGGELSAAAVADSVGLAGGNDLFGLSDCLIGRDLPGFFVALEQALSGFAEPQRLCEQLIGHWRDLMLAKAVESPESLIAALPDMLPRLYAQAEKCTLADILGTLSALQDCLNRMSRTALKRAELEMTAVRLCAPAATAPLPTPAPVTVQTNAGDGKKSAALPAGHAAPSVPGAAEPTVPGEPGRSAEDEPPLPPAPEGAFSEWPRVLERLASINSAVRSALGGSNAYLEGEHILIQCANPLFLTMIRENQYTRDIIKRAIAEVTGRRYPIGPYRTPVQKQEEDPLEEFIRSLPADDDSITIR